MADHGTAVMLPFTPGVVTASTLSPGLALGDAVLLPSSAMVVSAYALAGTAPPVIVVEPTVPTIGQLWPRGNA